MLKHQKIGFIGMGNMGSAIANSLLRAGAAAPSDVLVTDPNPAQTRALAEQGVRVVPSARELAEACDIVILAVKPQIYASVLEQVRGCTAPLYISIAAGVTVDAVQNAFSAPVRVVRVMPNTPALIGKGMSVLFYQPPATEADLALAKEIFASVGAVEVMDERYIDGVVALSGSGPAYVYMFIEAMADAGVAEGLPRDVAYRLAAQTAAGSAEMVLQTGAHPGVLKDRVCSPAGTTIAGVAALEKAGFRSAVIEGVRACARRSADMAK